MPVYEYQCKYCKNTFEKMRPISKSAEACECPKCQHKADRILSRCYCTSSNEGGTQVNLGGESSCSSCGGGSCSSCGSNN